MTFTHPEMLWALFLLIIPVIIHLFQLRKFRKE
ncbi:MAG: BatA domain-containing protein, partial [Sinomicrobium sp.]|nr:BatA domain-containing protein [Sinomicrobium sp.]